MNVPITLERYLLEQLKKHPQQIDLVMMMSSLATITKIISAQTNRSGLTDLGGLTGTSNIQDEHQAKLDVYANDLCKAYLESTGLFAALASEEEDTVVDLNNPQANYVIAFDPLDGSSNIDVNVSVGTIFSVHKKLPGVPDADEKQFLQAGHTQVLAGYALYSSSTMLVFSWGDGVHSFTLDVDLGEFILNQSDIKLPEACPYYSINEAYEPMMSAHDQAYLKFIKQKAPKLRWIASLVADFHRNLLSGGVFFFPAIDDGKGNFKPKLRLNYEVKPMAFLIEQAGGAATTGNQRILDIIPDKLHQRVAVILGNQDILKHYKEIK